MLGIISYLSSTIFFTPLLNFLLLPLAGYRLVRRSRFPQPHRDKILGFFILCCASFFSVAAFILTPPEIQNFDKSILGPFPYIILILAAILVAVAFKPKDLDYLAILVSIEILIGIAEYYSGTPSFFTTPKGETAFGDTALLYYNKVYGLSENSSALAFKTLVLFVYTWIRGPTLKRSVFYALSILVAIGLFITFNRTTILTIFLTILLINLKPRRNLIYISAFSVLIFVYFYEMILFQFFRGQIAVDYSGRDAVFSAFLDLIANNPLLGNSGAKVWLDLNGSLYHAHNSYLELIASNGIPIATLFVIGYLLLFRSSLRYAIPFLIYSFFQYGLYWGFVFHDIAIAALLFGAQNLRAARQPIVITRQQFRIKPVKA